MPATAIKLVQARQYYFIDTRKYENG